MCKQFQKILVVNLPSRTDRRDAMAVQAACTNLTLEFVPAVTDADEGHLPPGGSGLGADKPSGLGAWRSHLNAARM
jgi:hypothetical protein